MFSVQYPPGINLSREKCAVFPTDRHKAEINKLLGVDDALIPGGPGKGSHHPGKNEGAVAGTTPRASSRLTAVPRLGCNSRGKVDFPDSAYASATGASVGLEPGRWMINFNEEGR